MHAELHLLKGTLQVCEGTVTSDSLERGKSCLLDGVCVVKCFDGVFVSSCCHEEVTSINMHDWIFLVRYDKLLEVVEC
jgi:hypothetical protein